jgi:hypothetical protein
MYAERNAIRVRPSAGIVYFEPNYVGAPSNTFARLHPDGTQDELPVTGLVETGKIILLK